MSQEQTVSTEEVLAEVAEATAEQPAKKVRRAKHDADGQVLEMPKKEKKPKEPKSYPQWNEDGTPMLDENGERVMGPEKMKKPKVAKQPKLDENGNPIPRRERTVMLDSQVLIVTDAGREASAKFREGTKRRANFDAITPGITVGEYFEKTGGRKETATFLIWYIGQGYVELGGDAE